MSDENPGELSNLGNLGSSKMTLGSLAQSARNKHLRQARGILLFLGIFAIVVNSVMIATMRSRVHSMLQAEVQKLGPGFQVDQAKFQEVEDAAVTAGTIEAAGLIAAGVVFIVLGMFTRRHPVPTTVLGLTIYLGMLAYLSYSYIQAGKGERVASALIWKIVITIVLIRAVQSAIASEREKKQAEALGELA